MNRNGSGRDVWKETQGRGGGGGIKEEWKKEEKKTHKKKKLRGGRTDERKIDHCG